MTTGNNHKLQQEKYWVDIRKQIVRVELAEYWNKLAKKLWSFHPWRYLPGSSRSWLRCPSEGDPAPGCSPTVSECGRQRRGWMTGSINNPRRGKRWVRSKVQPESYQEQKEMEPKTRLEAKVQHGSKAHTGDRDRDRTGNKRQCPEALPDLPTPAHLHGSPHPTHGQDPISEPQSQQPGLQLLMAPLCPVMGPPSLGPQGAPGPPSAATVGSPRDNLSTDIGLRSIQEAGPEIWLGCWAGWSQKILSHQN